MCGIAGYINFNNQPVSKFILKEMGKAIEHRGPDGEGYWLIIMLVLRIKDYL